MLCAFMLFSSIINHLLRSSNIWYNQFTDHDYNRISKEDGSSILLGKFDNKWPLFEMQTLFSLSVFATCILLFYGLNFIHAILVGISGGVTLIECLIGIHCKSKDFLGCIFILKIVEVWQESVALMVSADCHNQKVVHLSHYTIGRKSWKFILCFWLFH